MFSQISFWELNVKTNAVLRLLMDSFNSKSWNTRFRILTKRLKNKFWKKKYKKAKGSEDKVPVKNQLKR
jgi:hypothetical protein